MIDAPEHKVAEILDGHLHLSPRPASPHAAASTALTGELWAPFKRGQGGPGGWILLVEPELHLGEDVLVPDVAGWRRARMPAMGDVPYFTMEPDWVCEVLSPSTSKIDRTQKLPIYARERVARTLEVLRREGSFWRIVGTFSDGDRVHAEPFGEFDLDLAILWADVQPPT